jgi:hypothetical protein
MKEPEKTLRAFAPGAKKAKKIAGETLREVKKLIGLR